jgi:hypothetical protein|tara:strand:+ start:482 stop:1216 length:735 start_codon:yes stop_codon:yes gene_type:complete
MKSFFLTILLFLIVTTAYAVDVVGQRYIDQMTQGGAISIKRAAQNIYHSGETNTEVLDVAAETLISKHMTAGNREADAYAWVAKALGASGNGRYSSVLKEVLSSTNNRSVRKYAKIALGQLGNSDVKQYKKGMVDLAAIRSGKKQSSKTKPVAKKRTNSGKASFDVVREGMSSQEVYDLIGTPTNTVTHQTGKAWNPFHVSGRDLVRTVALYKGQGQIIFTHNSYSGVSRVLEIIIDPNESGYP